jgi:hypothetical protein
VSGFNSLPALLRLRRFKLHLLSVAGLIDRIENPVRSDRDTLRYPESRDSLGLGAGGQKWRN